MKRTKLNKKLFTIVLITIMELSLISCGESQDSPSCYNMSSGSITSTESGLAAEAAFQEAVSDFTETISKLCSDLEDANFLLQNVTDDMVMDADILEHLDTISKQAESHLEDKIPDREGNAEDIYEQVLEIKEQISILRDLNEDLLLYMSEVEESKRLYEESNKSEIIMVNFKCNIGQNDITVYSVNPDTGQQNIISSFIIYDTVVYNESGRKWKNLISNIGASQNAPLKGMFSKNYKYIAVTRFALDTGEYHAGYYLENLAFADATEAADMAGGDFDELANQIAIGFDEEGRFVFAELPELSRTWIGGYHKYNQDWEVYQVKTADNGGIYKNSVKSYDTLDELQGDNWEWLEENCEVTDWVDETRCIVNYPEEAVKLMFGDMRIDRWGVRVFNMQTKEYFSLIPGETRTNWSGVISPDGKNIAFLSAPLTGNGSASLYSVPIEGGDPVKICDGISIGRTTSSNAISRPCNLGYSSQSINIVFLVEWKKVQ